MTQRMPNILLTVMSILRAANIADRVASDLRGFTSGDTWIVVTLSPSPGGERIKGRLFRPSLDINIYGPTTDSCDELARTVMFILSSSVNYHDENIVITEVDVTTPYDLTDLVNGSPRYVLSAAITCRPA
jgi:hypothetical protein